MDENNQIENKNKSQKIRDFFLKYKRNFLIAGVSFFISALFAYCFIILFSPPKNFPKGDIFIVNSGESLQTIANSMKEKGIIRSEKIFRSLVIFFGGEKKIIAGDYLLSKGEGAVRLALRLANGIFGINTIKITIPEGWNTYQIGDYLEKNIIKFDKEKFLNISKEYEGYLFPDTYFVSMSVRPEDIVKIMNDNFKRKTEDIKMNRKISDVIIMASILEGEALPKDRQVVAGILWKRLSIGMPLQVDATFRYINGKGTYDLTADDLKIDSPYNTYIHKGLPPGPISNPGIDAISASLNPIPTKYLYYLTEKDGTIHYAKTFTEHIANKNKYLK